MRIKDIMYSKWSAFSSVQSLSCVRLFVTPWTAVHQDSLSITKSQTLLKLMFIALVMPSSHPILGHPHAPAPSMLYPASDLEGLMLKLKLQYFGYLMRRVDSLKKTDAGRDWGQEEKGTTEDEMAGWHQQLDGHKFE